MPLSWEQHPDDEALEAYAMGTLLEDTNTRVEQHLLLCEQCRQSVEQTDDFLRTMKSVVSRPAAAPVSEREPVAEHDRDELSLDYK